MPHGEWLRSHNRGRSQGPWARHVISILQRKHVRSAMAGAGCARAPIRVRCACLLFLGLILMAGGLAHGQSFDGLLQTKRSAVNVATTIQQEGVLAPVAKLRVQRLYVERQKRGVLRIALLPKLVFEGAVFDLRDASALPVCMRQMESAITAVRQSRAVEFRGLRFEQPGPDRWVLEAKSAEPLGPSSWVLRQPTWRRGDIVALVAHEARLTVDPSGRVLLQDSSGARPDIQLSPGSVGTSSSSTPKSP